MLTRLVLRVNPCPDTAIARIIRCSQSKSNDIRETAAIFASESNARRRLSLLGLGSLSPRMPDWTSSSHCFG